MTKKFKKILVGVVTSAMCAAGCFGTLTASAILDSSPNTFLLNYANSAPSTEIRTSQYNYASMGVYDPGITIKVTGCTKSSNTKSCRFNVPLRDVSEAYWVPFSYTNQKKDIALKSHGSQVYFTCELVRTDTSQGYGNCNFHGTAN